MSWAKLDDRFPEHPKVIEAGGAAAWLYVSALCYWRKYNLDGLIPVHCVRHLLGGVRVSERRARAVADRLVAVGLWAPAEDGYRFIPCDLFSFDRDSIPDALREAVIERDGLVCGICRGMVDPGDVHLDHIIPSSRGGPTTARNLRVTHSRCNISKGARV